MSSLLSLREIRAGYGEREVVRGASLTVEAGEFCAYWGSMAVARPPCCVPPAVCCRLSGAAARWGRPKPPGWMKKAAHG